MTREDVIRIALEVGFDDGEINKCQLMLERFAYLVAQQERERIAKEIEKITAFGKDTISSFTIVIRDMKNCPPCHGDCNQGRTCPARNV